MILHGTWRHLSASATAGLHSFSLPGPHFLFSIHLQALTWLRLTTGPQCQRFSGSGQRRSVCSVRTKNKQTAAQRARGKKQTSKQPPPYICSPFSRPGQRERSRCTQMASRACVAPQSRQCPLGSAASLCTSRPSRSALHRPGGQTGAHQQSD